MNNSEGLVQSCFIEPIKASKSLKSFGKNTKDKLKLESCC